jgi:hypothetical protein
MASQAREELAELIAAKVQVKIGEAVGQLKKDLCIPHAEALSDQNARLANIEKAKGNNGSVTPLLAKAILALCVILASVLGVRQLVSTSTTATLAKDTAIETKKNVDALWQLIP